jgi:hypothetical protein
VAEQERKLMMNLADTIEGEINRMCVTNDLAELDAMALHAKKNIEKLSRLIYDARFRKLEVNEK